MKNYIKDVLNILLGMSLVFITLIILMVVVTWDFSIFNGNRFWNDHTKSFIRLLIIFSFIIATFMRVRLSIKIKGLE